MANTAVVISALRLLAANTNLWEIASIYPNSLRPSTTPIRQKSIISVFISINLIDESSINSKTLFTISNSFTTIIYFVILW